MHSKIVVVMAPFGQWSTVPLTSLSDAATSQPICRYLSPGAFRRHQKGTGFPCYAARPSVACSSLSIHYCVKQRGEEYLGRTFSKASALCIVCLTSWRATCIAQASNEALYVMLNVLFLLGFHYLRLASRPIAARRLPSIALSSLLRSFHILPWGAFHDVGTRGSFVHLMRALCLPPEAGSSWNSRANVVYKDLFSPPN